MKIALVQFHTVASIQENLNHMQEILSSLQADFIVLPELWICPYENQKIEEAKVYAEKARSLLQIAAKKNKSWIIGGTLPYDNQNLCFVFDRQGKQIATYAKAHLLEVHATHTYKESDVFTPGNSLCCFDTEWGKMGVLICYDIRFPEMSRILAQSGIQILFLPAAFNKKVGEAHWKPLLQTRAMENEIFIVAVNPDYSYQAYQAYGHSLIANPFGKVLYEIQKEEVLTCDIDLEEIQKIRNRMPLWKLRRTDLYEIKEKEYERNQHS